MDSKDLSGPWYRGMTGYHWWVLIIASLGWLFDTMDQRIFVLARGPALEDTAAAGDLGQRNHLVQRAGDGRLHVGMGHRRVRIRHFG